VSYSILRVFEISDIRLTRNPSNEAFVKAQFTPVLRAYITEQYQETQIIKAEVDVSSIWQADLVGLASTTTWILTHDKATGRYTITEA
jgi:hypothetical protein